MTALPPIHICIVQPLGYVHSLGLVDPARYFRYQFRRFGADVSIAKNRLRHDAVNFVFGAHLGFEPALRQRHACVFVNLEQLGEGGAQVSPAYLDLLRRSAVVDYDADNVAAYADDAASVPVVPVLHAPYLAPAAPLPLHERPIDLLFVGSINARRTALIERIERAGVQVTMFDSALYGDERDAYIAQAKAVLNLHFYESSRFEQVRVSHCLSLGTPVISERGPACRPHEAFASSVLWLPQHEPIEAYFRERFLAPDWHGEAHAAVQAFRAADPVEAYADLLAFAVGFGRAHHERRPQQPWQPARIHIGSGKDYKPGWLNLDVLARAEPDLVLDLAQPQAWPLQANSPTVGPLVLDEGQAEVIVANNVLEHVADLPRLMTHALQLLKTGGRLMIEVPYEHAATAWQDPTHVRAMNENSWLYYTDWFWYLGWYEHRFAVEQSGYLDLQLRACAREQAAFMRVTLVKVATTLRERMQARTLDAGVHCPDDLPSAESMYRPAAAPLAAADAADAALPA
ncbi:MAG: methyltransferase domain-containing protein [Ideonella sp.]|nr:methyltransferase domain-containing protein [Ideonella sp.]MCC7457887.1 methyltransferase domain-containing protein [Nitrospira sp.]